MKTVLDINNKYLNKLVDYYNRYIEKPSSPHIKYLFKTDNLTVTVYNSNKVVFQGDDAEAEYEKWLKITGTKPDILKPTNSTLYLNEHYKKCVIGSDEVGTGDFFGPIVVCACLVCPRNYPFLSELNIQDSKNMSDNYIKEVAPRLISEIPHQLLVLNNEKFNKLTKEGYNLNKIKAYLHNHAIKKMINKKLRYDEIIIDKFSSDDNYFKYLQDQDTIKDILLIEKAESIHRSVAVAAIIARYKFLQEMDILSKKININLPKGASASVDAIGKLILLKYGEKIFNSIAKTNYKNMDKIKN
ncbi:MAG: ribonuclease HIII [Bacillota bacterium]